MEASRAQQYLKAMGITAWEPRTAGQPVETNTQAAVDPTPQLTQSSNSILPLAVELPVGSYTERLAEATVECLQTGSGQLMLIIEPPALTEEDKQLLGKMLGAIHLDIDSQTLVGFAENSQHTARTLLATHSPQVVLVLVMAKLQGNTTALLDHRASLQQASWCQAHVAVTHHPADLTLHAELKRPAWEDLKRVKAVLDG